MSLRKSSPKGKLSAIFSVVLSLAIAGITLIALVSDRGWPLYLELLSHFRLQYFLFSLVLLLPLVLTRRKVAILIALFCIALLSTPVLPWYNPFSRSTAEGNLRVITANLHVSNHRYEEVVSWVRRENPDVAVFIEIDDAWVDQLRSLKDILPYNLSRPNPYNLGIAIFSRLPLENSSVEPFGTQDHIGLVANVTVENQSISLVAAHPPPPIRRSLFHIRNTQLDQIGRYIQSLDTPVVLLGDLNITMWSPYYRRLIRNTGLHNARRGFGVLPTWPEGKRIAGIPTAMLTIPIDHCLVSPDVKVAKIYVGPNTGSDHLPLVADLIIPPKT